MQVFLEFKYAYFFLKTTSKSTHRLPTTECSWFKWIPYCCKIWCRRFPRLALLLVLDSIYLVRDWISIEILGKHRMKLERDFMKSFQIFERVNISLKDVKWFFLSWYPMCSDILNNTCQAPIRTYDHYIPWWCVLIGV
jgi:hypothetical protein